MKTIWLILAIILANLSIALADPVWVPPKGTLYTTISLTAATWDQFYQRSSSAIDLPGEIAQWEISMTGDYALLDNLSLDISLPIVISEKKFVYLETDSVGNILGVQTGEDGAIRDVDTNIGLGDLTLGAKYIFWEDFVSLGIRPHIKFPGTYAYGSVVNSPGDGNTDIGLAFILGAYFPKIRSYLRGSMGYVLRFQEPKDQFEFMIEPGVNITRELSARFLYQYVEQLGGTNINWYGLPNYYPANEEDAHRIGVGIAYQANEMLGLFGTYQMTLAGKNTSNTKAFSLGLSFSF